MEYSDWEAMIKNNLRGTPQSDRLEALLYLVLRKLYFSDMLEETVLGRRGTRE
jgi:hypothetical protein